MELMTTSKTLPDKVTKKQCAEFGQAATLVLLYFAIHNKNNHLVTAALVVILVTIVLPIIFYPLAYLWFGFSGLLSKVSPVIILTMVFFVVVTPVGLIRRFFGKDSMRLKQFKKSKSSAMIDKNHLHTAADLLHTF